jgi:RimJ/RimL family protein N-acetyltransferase
VRRCDLDDHPRVLRSYEHRRDVRVLGDERGLVTIGSGLVGRTEVSVELTGGAHSRGAGRGLITAALLEVAAAEPVFAQVAAGNAASLRAFLACGFTPIGSEVLITPASPGREG